MPKVCIVKIVLISPKEKVLLGLRDSHVKHPNMWGFWGGYMEKGETPEMAIVREVKEEIDYDLEAHTQIEERMEDGEKRVWFIGEISKGIKKLKLSEGQDFGFFTYEETKNIPMSKNTRDFLKKVFEEEPKMYKQFLRN